MVEFSWPRKRNFSKPPSGGSLLRIWWLWVYWPRKMVALLGQHKELLTKDSSNVVPLSMSSFFRLGMCLSAFRFRSAEVRSSVRMRITFGGFGFSAVSLGGFPSAEGKQAESAQATASPRSTYIPMKSVLFVRSTAFAFVSTDGSRRKAVPVSLAVPRTR